jgi:hypothetical protein
MYRPSPRPGAVLYSTLETLEPRRLFAATPQIDFSNFASTTGLVFNGYGHRPTTAQNTLVVTDGVEAEARSVYYNTAVGIQNFQTTFYFSIAATPTSPAADGFTFILQNDGINALGAAGSGLGFQKIGKSFGISLDLYNYDTNKFESDFRFLSDGVGTTNITPVPMAPVNLHLGDLLVASISYDGTTASVHIVDLTRNTSFRSSEAVDLHTVLDGWTAYAGFTGSTGLNYSDQNIHSWTYTGSAPVLAAPTVQTAAAADPNPVTNLSTDLSVLGASGDGANSLTYTWSTLQAPPGAHAVLFSDNGDDFAKDVTARFFKDGGYVFQCTITDVNGQTTTSDVKVVVEQTAKQLKLEPHGTDIVAGKTEQFIGVVLDQFGHPMRTDPTITYSILTGPGSINAATGLYKATSTLGHVDIKAVGDGLIGTAAATVIV